MTDLISPTNACEPFRELILSKLEQGLDGQRIYQDLRDDEEGFTASYSSVRRFLVDLRETRPLPVRRIETAAGEEAQVDFGTGAWVISNGKRKRPWVLRVVLSHSRSHAQARTTRCIQTAADKGYVFGNSF